jgi:hypothetical protein
LGEGLFRVVHCLAAPHPGPLPGGEREQKGAWCCNAPRTVAAAFPHGVTPHRTTLDAITPAKAGAQLERSE